MVFILTGLQKLERPRKTDFALQGNTWRWENNNRCDSH
jgi:hypothetical protein